MSNPPPCAPVCVIDRRLPRAALLSLVLAIGVSLPGSALAQAFVCYAEPDSVDAVLAAGGQGEHRWTWDGRDDAGRGAPSGVYFARIVTGSDVQSVRMTLVQ